MKTTNSSGRHAAQMSASSTVSTFNIKGRGYFADPTTAHVVAVNLRTIRLTNDLTQSEMAAVLGVSRTSYSGNERGKHLSEGRISEFNYILGTDLRTAEADAKITRSPCAHHVRLVGDNDICPACAMLSRRHAEGWF